ncbi:putative disease resistance protein At3g14460 [Miscanthus floridulus]|uniref:putative disease resistance protein At3g14460 n=1 Tax=Miscanthus floridulus TaxID=154761 RepID=UPI00345A0368
MSHLINLRHLLANKDLHCKIAEVGKLKFLQELRKFEVRKDVTGFELHELSELTELTGSLSICNLENVKTKRDADTAKLILKGKLDKLKLVRNSQWPNRDPTVEDVLESLRPHPNLRELCIKDHGGSTCPYWLRTQRSIKMLKSLHLHGISWKTLPPFGQMSDLMELKMENISSMHQFGGTEFGQITDGSFQKLMVLKIADMPQLEKWVGAGALHLFHQLKKLAISNCPKLSELPFSHCITSSTEDSNKTWFPNFRELVIEACPQLSLPPLPHTSTTDLVRVKTTNGYFSYNRNELVIDAYNGALSFHSMHKLEELYVCKTSLSLTGLQNLTSLRKLDIKKRTVKASQLSRRSFLLGDI